MNLFSECGWGWNLVIPSAAKDDTMSKNTSPDTKKGEDLKCDPKAQKEVQMEIMKFPGHPPASYTFLVQSLADCP